MTPPLIALCGYSGSGKDTVARLLGERWRVARLAFADELKRELAAAWHVDTRVFHDPGLKEVSLQRLALTHCTNAAFVAAHPELAMLDALKPRTVMQAWGDWTALDDPSHYVRVLSRDYHAVALTRPQAIVVTDARLTRERQWLRGMGATFWRVTRAGQRRPSGHATEHVHRAWSVDAEIVNVGNADDLAKRASDLLLDVLNHQPGRAINAA